MSDYSDIIGGAVAIAAAWTVSVAVAIADGGAVGAIMLAFSGALTMVWVGQRRQRQMLVESIELARADRDECRRELSELKVWIANNLERRTNYDRDGIT